MNPVSVSCSGVHLYESINKDEDDSHNTNRCSRPVETRQTCSKKSAYKNTVQRLAVSASFKFLLAAPEDQSYLVNDW